MYITRYIKEFFLLFFICKVIDQLAILCSNFFVIFFICKVIDQLAFLCSNFFVIFFYLQSHWQMAILGSHLLKFFHASTLIDRQDKDEDWQTDKEVIFKKKVSLAWSIFRTIYIYIYIYKGFLFFFMEAINCPLSSIVDPDPARNCQKS